MEKKKVHLEQSFQPGLLCSQASLTLPCLSELPLQVPAPWSSALGWDQHAQYLWKYLLLIIVELFWNSDISRSGNFLTSVLQLRDPVLVLKGHPFSIQPPMQALPQPLGPPLSLYSLLIGFFIELYLKVELSLWQLETTALCAFFWYLGVEIVF